MFYTELNSATWVQLSDVNQTAGIWLFVLTLCIDSCKVFIYLSLYKMFSRAIVISVYSVDYHPNREREDCGEKQKHLQLSPFLLDKYIFTTHSGDVTE